MGLTTEAMGRVGIWTATFDGCDSKQVADTAAEIEALGYRGLWIPEMLGRDPFVAATILLGATNGLVVATGIANIWARDEVTTNTLNYSLNETYNNRFLLGLGVSHHNLVEWVRKHDYSKPYSKMVEYLDRMAKCKYRAIAPSEIPEIVIAALGPKMLALAAEKTSGAHPYLVPPEHTVIAREAIGPDSWLAPEQMMVLETDATKARDIARLYLPTYLKLPNYANNLVRLGYSQEDIDAVTDEVVDAVVVWGDEQACAKRVKEHLDAGADHVSVQVLEADPTKPPLEAWRRMAPALLN